MKRIIAMLLCLVVMCSAASAADESTFRVRNGDRSKNQVAVTIDDCFNIEYVRKAYELTQQYNVPITFFVLGMKLDEADRDLWRTIAESQNEIGNHTWGHRDLSNLNHQQIYVQLSRTQADLDRVLGYHYPMQVFRPPYGHLNRNGKNHINRAVMDVGYDHGILWDISQTNFKKCIAQVQNGSIMLFHTNPADLRCMEQLIPALLEKGYELVTISQMLGKDPVATSTDLYEFVEYDVWRKEKGL